MQLNVDELPVAFVEFAPAPLFLLGPATSQVLERLFGEIDVGAVGCHSLADAEISPDDLATARHHAPLSPVSGQAGERAAAQAEHLNDTVRSVNDRDSPLVLLCRPDETKLAQWIVDILPRLWVLGACGHDLATLRYLVPDSLPAVLLEALANAGVKPAQLETYASGRTRIAAKLLLIPTGLRTQERVSPHFRAATDLWAAPLRARAAVPEAARCVFIAGDHLANAGELGELARQRGTETVRLYGLGLSEQAALLSGAGTIIGESSDLLTAAVFADAGARMTALTTARPKDGFALSGVARALGHRLGYLFGRPDEDADRFTIEPAIFETALDILQTHTPP